MFLLLDPRFSVYLLILTYIPGVILYFNFVSKSISRHFLTDKYF